MSSKDLAQLFVKCWQLHEQSWNGQRYEADWYSCAQKVTDDTFLQQVLYVSLAYSSELVGRAEEFLKEAAA